MSVPLTVGNTTYQYAVPGQDPGWGEDNTAWAVAVTEVLGTLVGVGDIVNSSALLLDNISVATDVSGLSFDGAQVRAVNVTYALIRGAVTQSGTLQLNFNTSAPMGSKWTLAEQSINDVGVQFSVTDSGQIQYITSSTGTNVQMRFNAKALSA